MQLMVDGQVGDEELSAPGCRWLHADYQSGLRAFYEDACGLRPTAAGLLDLTAPGDS